MGHALVWCLGLLPLLGIRSKENGWRRTANVFLRSEVSKFALSAFALDFWSDVASGANDRPDRNRAEQHVALRLAVWLRTQADVQWQVEWTRFGARRRAKKFVDVTVARFGDDGGLMSIEAMLDARSPAADHIGNDEKRRLRQMLVSCYNGTRALHDLRRPRALGRLVAQSIDAVDWSSADARDEAHDYARCILSSNFVSFDQIGEGEAGTEGRFGVPEFRLRKHPGFGLLNFVVRFDPTLRWTDVWMQIDHVAGDGVPMQEAINDLRQEWGVCEALRFPAPTAARPAAVRCSTPYGAGSIYAQVAIVDFQNLLTARRRLNARYQDRLAGGVTLSSLLVWALGHHPRYRRTTFAVTVDVAAEGACERVVGLVSTRPGDFMDADDEEGFARFVEHFNSCLEASRERRGTVHRVLEASAPLPPLVHGLVAKLLPGFVAQVIGTVGVSIIKDAEVFVAPYNGLFSGGFLALGNISVATDAGSTAGAVSAKGSQHDVRVLHEVLGEVLDLLADDTHEDPN